MVRLTTDPSLVSVVSAGHSWHMAIAVDLPRTLFVPHQFWPSTTTTLQRLRILASQGVQRSYKLL